ncbi:MAG: NADH-quinone oxidoreductase subunit C [Thermoplasmataceae archaeon]
MVDISEEPAGKDKRKIFRVKKENLLEVMKSFYEQGFDHLSLITGIDRRDRIEIVYHLHSLKNNEYIVVKTDTQNDSVQSVTSIWKSADWDEREQYDMLGIIFEGHPNLKRILLPEGWIGHPLRKNYDLSKIQYVNMDENGNDYASFDPGDGW